MDNKVTFFSKERERERERKREASYLSPFVSLTIRMLNYDKSSALMINDKSSALILRHFC